MADGLAIAEHLRRKVPDAFGALTTLEWVFSTVRPSTITAGKAQLSTPATVGFPTPIERSTPCGRFRQCQSPTWSEPTPHCGS